ncbi:MAG TPA: sulfur carrier protein ThiS [Mycobacteriales bacterium]
MTVTVNGQPRDLPAGTTVATVVAGLARGDTGVAVAVNDTVVHRGAWQATALDDGDRVEVITAVQGG